MKRIILGIVIGILVGSVAAAIAAPKANTNPNMTNMSGVRNDFIAGCAGAEIYRIEYNKKEICYVARTSNSDAVSIYCLKDK